MGFSSIDSALCSPPSTPESRSRVTSRVYQGYELRLILGRIIIRKEYNNLQIGVRPDWRELNISLMHQRFITDKGRIHCLPRNGLQKGRHLDPQSTHNWFPRSIEVEKTSIPSGFTEIKSRFPVFLCPGAMNPGDRRGILRGLDFSTPHNHLAGMNHFPPRNSKPMPDLLFLLWQKRAMKDQPVNSALACSINQTR